MAVSRKFLVTMITAPLLATSSLVVSTVTADAANASTSHSMMTAHTWKGTITKLDAKMGSTEAFNLKVGMKSYTVHYTSMTKFEMGNAAMLKKGTFMTVTGSLKGGVITATKFNV